MKVALVFNRQSRKVINLFGVPNRERIGMRTIQRLMAALRKGGHQVAAIEGDKDIISRLEDFMPRVMKGERPGLVFNVSYGIQGEARYTHVPGILEMVGVPYVGSGPLAHSLALDKVVTKMILRQHGLPTPDFAIVESVDAGLPRLEYPLIVKPKHEAVSFGLKVVTTPGELKEAAKAILDTYSQPVLVERYIEGVEINVGLLGNSPPEALPPVMLDFGGGEAVYTYEDKTGRSGRTIGQVCPAPLDAALLQRAQDLAVRAFTVLGCHDCARVDMRIDGEGEIWILEINSLPALGEHASYVKAAETAGMDFPALVNRLIEVASARYFGTPRPPEMTRGGSPGEGMFSFLAERRDQLERRLREWTRLSSRTGDAVGIREGMEEMGRVCEHLALKKVEQLSSDPFVRTWETRKGLDGGTLIVAHLDVPLESAASRVAFRREPEWIFGEGVGVSRGPLVMLEYALRALRSQRLLRKVPAGVLVYTDEGLDCRYSAETIRRAAGRAKQVIVLRPGRPGDRMLTQRRGHVSFRLRAWDEPRRPGRIYRRPDLVRWVSARIGELCKLTAPEENFSVSVADMRTKSFPPLLPHEVTVRLLLTYLEEKTPAAVERSMREVLTQKARRWELEKVSERPPMRERRLNQKMAASLGRTAKEWGIPLRKQSSVWPSVAGLVPPKMAVICGLGPVAVDLNTPQEALQRISLVQRTLLLAQFLAGEHAKAEKG